MYLVKVSSMKIGQYGYDYVINECYVIMDGDELLSIIRS